MQYVYYHIMSVITQWYVGGIFSAMNENLILIYIVK
jgi:hypothetical protein